MKWTAFALVGLLIGFPGLAQAQVFPGNGGILVTQPSGNYVNGPGQFSTIVATGSVTGASFIPSDSTIPTNGMYLSAANTPAISANSLAVATFASVASANRNLTFTNGASSGSTNATIGTNSGSMNFAPGGVTQLRVRSDISTAVNIVDVFGGATGNGVQIRAAGETDIDFNISSAGAGSVGIFSGGTARLLGQFINAASSTQYLKFIPTNGAGGVLDTSAGALTLKSAGTTALTLSTTFATFGAGMINAHLSTGTNADTVCLAADGTFLIQAAACTISSARFKRDIEYLDSRSSLARVLQARPVAFNMIGHNVDENGNRRQIGLIAEDVAQIDSRLALYEPDGVTPKSYRQEAIIADLVGAVKEQQRQIEELKAQLIRTVPANDNFAVPLIKTGTK